VSGSAWREVCVGNFGEARKQLNGAGFFGMRAVMRIRTFCRCAGSFPAEAHAVATSILADPRRRRHVRGANQIRPFCGREGALAGVVMGKSW